MQFQVKCVAIVLGLLFYNFSVKQPRKVVIENVYSFSDEKLVYTARIKFTDNKRILFDISSLNKKTGKKCVFNGTAVSRLQDRGTSTDENGVDYLTTEYIFAKGLDYIYFTFQAANPMQSSKRLEITASTNGIFKGCDYNTEYYILFKQKSN